MDMLLSHPSKFNKMNLNVLTANTVIRNSFSNLFVELRQMGGGRHFII